MYTLKLIIEQFIVGTDTGKRYTFTLKVPFVPRLGDMIFTEPGSMFGEDEFEIRKLAWNHPTQEFWAMSGEGDISDGVCPESFQVIHDNLIKEGWVVEYEYK